MKLLIKKALNKIMTVTEFNPALIIAIKYAGIDTQCMPQETLKVSREHHTDKIE